LKEFENDNPSDHQTYHQILTEGDIKQLEFKSA